MDQQEPERQVERVAFELFETEKYAEKIQEMLGRGHRRLPIDLSDLRRLNFDLTSYLLKSPGSMLPIFDRALSDSVKRSSESTQSEFKVTFEGPFGGNFVTPRGLTGHLANSLVMVQGIITRMSLVRPKIIKSVHYCETTRSGHVKTYNDQYEIGAVGAGGNNNSFPTKDPDGNPLVPEFGLCQYKDQQTLVIQEVPERAPAGQLPRSVEIVLEEDLVNTAKPGDRVNVVGVFKTIVTSSSSAAGIFKTIVMARSISYANESSLQPMLTGEDLRNIKSLAQDPRVLDLLGESLAPSIFGHSFIKKALVLLMLSGVEKNLANGTHLRGDINILLIGDPSTAKSQLLRCVLNIAPLATNTTGRGSSGVGLTAAVTFDKDTGERHLEAGAMVLADRGIICIDEFDKMNEVDRVAIHEVMEQQTVTIAKAGIHTSLNARCSVLAAANPIYGTYQKDLAPSKNITLPDSLLSRFDFLFIILDQQNSETDRMIAERVLLNHSYTGVAAGELGDLDNPIIETSMKADPEEEAPMYTRHGSKQLLHRTFLKKYFHYAKQRVQPELTEDTAEYITNCWVEQRVKESDRKLIMPITVRTLETLIRISTAVAKAHLSHKVNREHCDEALKVLKFALYQEEEEGPQDVEMTEAASVIRTFGSSSRSKRARTQETPALKSMVHSSPTVDAVKSIVFRALSDLEGVSTLTVEQLWTLAQKKGAKNQQDVLAAVEMLENESKVMFSKRDNTVTLIK